MPDPYFFGYGSLVNRATHAYTTAHRARVKGWRRAWRYTSFREGPFLTAVPCPLSEIEGLIAQVPGGDWRALDAREVGYRRLQIGPELIPEAGAPSEAQIYAVPATDTVDPTEKQPILLSYVDVVFQGYLREFGVEGVARFIATTDGWEAPILDDRTAPLYPRHQPLSADERHLFDASLKALNVTIVPL